MLGGFKGDAGPFGEIVEPHLAHIAPSKAVLLAVLPEQRADASTQVELSDGARHRWWR